MVLAFVALPFAGDPFGAESRWILKGPDKIVLSKVYPRFVSERRPARFMDERKSVLTQPKDKRQALGAIAKALRGAVPVRKDGVHRYRASLSREGKAVEILFCFEGGWAVVQGASQMPRFAPLDRRAEPYFVARLGR